MHTGTEQQSVTF